MTNPVRVAPDADAQSAAEAIAIELAARDLYDAAIAAGASDPLWEALREQHESYAQRLAGLIGATAAGADADMFGELEGTFGVADPAAAAVELENTLVAGHVARLGEVSGTELVSALASIVAAESRHAVVTGRLAGETDPEFLFVNPLTPSIEAGA
jgi:Asp/Glu/hydantoin racemase